MTSYKVRVKVPASTANLGPGFDVLGMALNVYAWIEMGISTETTIHLYGDELQGIPMDKSNLIYKVAQQVFERAGVDIPELEISMYSDIPLTRGLGSSASAIIGGMVAANALIEGRLSNDTIFQMATTLEHHPDNVGAALFGGIVVSFWDGERAEYISINPPQNLEVLVAIPEFQLSTEKARNVLPNQFPMKDAVYNVGHSSLLVAAFCTGRLDMIPLAMKDKLHQPYRSALVPGMDTILREAIHYGALGVALSGAGPTLLTLMDTKSKDKQRIEQFLIETLRKENIEAKLMWLKPSQTGVQILTTNTESCTFIEYVKGDASG